LAAKWLSEGRFHHRGNHSRAHFTGFATKIEAAL